VRAARDKKGYQDYEISGMVVTIHALPLTRSRTSNNTIEMGISWSLFGRHPQLAQLDPYSRPCTDRNGDLISFDKVPKLVGCTGPFSFADEVVRGVC